MLNTFSASRILGNGRNEEREIERSVPRSCCSANFTWSAISECYFDMCMCVGVCVCSAGAGDSSSSDSSDSDASVISDLKGDPGDDGMEVV